MKRVLILMLALTTLAAARDKKPKAQPGPYVFTSKASAQTIRTLIVQDNVNNGYALDSDHPLQLRFSKPGQMPVIGALFMASSACPGMTTKQVWSYTLVEVDGATKVTVQPVWEYPDDYCQTQTHELIWNKPEEIAAFQAMLDKAPAASAQADSPASAPVSPAVAPAPVPAAAAYQQQMGAATQSAAQAGSPDENSENAARRAKQHVACMELAKDNPSIICK
jgi:hypothetical protein